MPEIRPCLASAETQFYRNKLEFTFAPRRWMTYEEIAAGGDIDARPRAGIPYPQPLRQGARHRKVLVAARAVERAAQRDQAASRSNTAIRFHNIREHAGLMRNLIVRTASTGEVMAIVVFGEEDTPRIEALMSHVAERFPRLRRSST